jgi:hypothetical protein
MRIRVFLTLMLMSLVPTVSWAGIVVAIPPTVYIQYKPQDANSTAMNPPGWTIVGYAGFNTNGVKPAVGSKLGNNLPLYTFTFDVSNAKGYVGTATFVTPRATWPNTPTNINTVPLLGKLFVPVDSFGKPDSAGNISIAP